MATRLTLAALAIAGATLAAAQTDPAAQPTFRSGVDLVRFDLRIVDDAGRPVTDLRAGEVEIYENGQRLPLLLFQRVTEPADSYVEAAIRAVSAEVSSNEAFPRGHLYILVFDQQHITPGSEHRARRAAEQFIRRRVRPSDRVALYAIPGPGLQIEFTSDKLRAIKELAAIRGQREPVVSSALGTMTAYEAHRVVQGDDKLTVDLLARMGTEAGTGLGGADPILARTRQVAPEDPGVRRRLLQENARTIVNQTDSESRQFLQRLADVIAGFRDIEGRKIVVLFSEGFFQDNLFRELETVSAAAAQSYCVFYTFDLNARSTPLTQLSTSETTLANEIQARIAPLSTLAVETDGMMVVDAAARSEQALDTIADQAQEYYLVGFAPSEEARLNRGKYRRVTIKLKRAGARASARTGYAVAPETTPADRRRAIDRVLGAPFVQQGLRIDYTTYVAKAPGGAGHRVVLSLSAELPLRSKPTDVADVVFVARDVRDGRVAASGTDTIPLPVSASPGRALGTSAWRVQFTVPPGTYLMRTVVREPGGMVGSADRRLEVRPLDAPDVTVSDLVVGSALAALPVRPRAYAGDGLTGVLEIYGRTAVQLEGLHTKVELRTAQGASVISMPAELSAPEVDADGLTRRATFVVPLESVAPGDYLAHAVVTTRGEIVAERTRQVEVLAGRAPAAPAGGSNPAERPATVSPVEVLRGELARVYLASLVRRAEGTDAYMAARRASDGKWEEVELRLQGVSEKSGPVPEALLGLALFARENYAAAAVSLDRSAQADPRNALTAFFLGWAHEGAGDARAALSAWRSAAHLDPTLVSAHLALAEGYLRLSEPALAIQALKAGLAALPSSAELQARLHQLEGKHP